MSWSLIASLDSPTGGVFTFTGLSLGAFSIVQLRGYGITVTTDGTDLRVTFYVGGVEQTSGYDWCNQQIAGSASNNNDGATAQASALLVSNDSAWDVGNASTEGAGCIIHLDRPASTSLHKRGRYTTWYGSPANLINTIGQAQLNNAGAIDGVKIGGTSNLLAGKIRLYGLA